MVLLLNTVLAQSSLAEQRKQTIDASFSGYFTLPGVSADCGTTMGESKTTFAIFPAGKASPLLQFGGAVLSAFEFQDEGLVRVFSAGLGNGEESLRLGNALGNYFAYKQFPMEGTVCGQLPPFEGELDVFGTFMRWAYAQRLDADGNVTCEETRAEQLTYPKDHLYGEPCGLSEK